MKNARSLMMIAGAGLALATAAVAGTVDTGYRPPYTQRGDFFLPTPTRPNITRSVEELIHAETGRPAYILTAQAFKETDGSMTVCGAYGSLGRNAIFVMNTGDAKTRDGLLLTNPSEATFNAFGCSSEAGVLLR